MADNSSKTGLIARIQYALRYAATGAAPSDWFGPGVPLAPQAPENVRGRQADYPSFVNISYKPRSGETISFEGLKRLATHPLVAMLIQRQKDKVAALNWHIVPRKVGSAATGVKAADPMIATITEFLLYPDKEHDWGQWIGAMLDQLMVLDAVTVYAAPTRAGDLYALQLIDGATIKPIIDLGGRRPVSPSPAYQQAIKGLPAVDYTTDEMIYFPQVYRPDRIYGYSRVEQAYDLIEAAISRLKSQRGYFDHGNVGDGFFTTPDGWTPDMIKLLEAQWNSMMQGDPGARRESPMLPHGVTWNPTKVDILSDTFDEYLIRQLCFPFGVAPQPFMKQTGMGHGSAGTEHDAAEEGGIAPLMEYIARLVNLVIAKWFKCPSLEFAWVEDREFDPAIKAAIEDQRLRNGTLTINEVRDRNGEQPIEGGDDALIYLVSGPVLIKDIAAQADAAAQAAQAAAQAALSPPAPVMALPAPGDPAGPPVATDDPKLAKAADRAATIRLGIILTAYLKAKGETVGKQIAGQLFKSAMDNQNGKIESALNDAIWTWDDLPPMTEPLIAGIAVAAGEDAAKALGSDLFTADTLARVSARATAYARDRAAELVGMKWDGEDYIVNPDPAWSIAETTRTRLRGLIEQAMADGQSNNELAKNISESVLFGSDRAMTIARTETAVADVRGAASAWIESGIVQAARFDASPDCCEDCQAEDGTIVPLAEADDLELPHVNCRCSFSAVLDNDGASSDQGDDDNG